MSIVGSLIAESMRTGTALDGITLTVNKVWRADVGDRDAGQPRTWTFIEFEAADEDAELLARRLESVLDSTGGWYCDFRSDTETFVAFSGRTFRYPRGDPSGRVAVQDYGRGVGVPEAQLDWPV